MTILESHIFFLANQLNWQYSEIMKMPVSRRSRIVERQQMIVRDRMRQAEQDSARVKSTRTRRR
jgi:hypothetical protein